LSEFKERMCAIIASPPKEADRSSSCMRTEIQLFRSVSLNLLPVHSSLSCSPLP
jgi:hypothetical protein